MKTLLILDKKDYTEDMPVFEKFSTRAVIIRNGKIATQHGNAGDYKILGGGVEPGEDLHEALIREVQEESGLVVIPSSIQTIGEIVERSDAEEKMVETHMTESEIAKGFHLEWATPQEILDGNKPFCSQQPWSYRDSEFIRMLPELMHADK